MSPRFYLESPRAPAIRPISGVRRPRFRPPGDRPALDLVPKAVLLQPSFALLRRVAPIGIDITARVARVEDVVKVLAVVHGGGVGLDPADDLVLLVDIDRQLVAEVALAVPLRPGRVGVLLAPLRRLPVGGIAPCSMSGDYQEVDLSFSKRLTREVCSIQSNHVDHSCPRLNSNLCADRRFHHDHTWGMTKMRREYVLIH